MSPGTGPSSAPDPNQHPNRNPADQRGRPEGTAADAPAARAPEAGAPAPGAAAAAAPDDGPSGAEAAEPTDETAERAREAAHASRDREAAETAKVGTFASLKIHNYRIFFAGAVVSNTGTWMQRIAQDWLVHTLTGSAAAVGMTIALQFLPMLLFGLYGGVLADRLDKRKLLICTQASMGLTGLVLAALTLSGNVEVVHVYALAFILGVVTVLDNPARQTFVSDMVGPGLLRNAVSLNSANFQTARIVGPAVAGVLIGAVGSGYAFLFNGLSFIAPVAGLLLMRTAELNSAERAPRSKGQLREGLRYVGSRPDLLWPIVLVGFIGSFGFNFPIWVVAFTDRIFEAGAGTYGLLNALMAVGSLTGALIAARWGASRTRWTVASAGLFGTLLMVLSGAPTLWVFAALLVPTGLVGMTFMISGNTSLQLASDPAMRGRVISLYMMVFLGGTPFGGPLMGWLTDSYGPRVALVLAGAICATAALGVAMALGRVGGLRLQLRLRRGEPLIAFVPRRPAPGGEPATGTEPATTQTRRASSIPGHSRTVNGPSGVNPCDR
ncbi:MFS transporter [Streptomyces bohaiensis]|uniref:MFS transporter n=1 Tax=Streptomyces bohaiensis TaxID=1431344 RepID=A0ABX1CF13_9ACTN|nr:MFS transporter [Streptomyces bohaiensis]NJQ15772.1 MFS transporter [Streptomyces bohaiensis]